MSKAMLFERFSFSGLTLKNRIVRSATYEKAADDDGFVTDRLLKIYSDLAEGGCGLAITGCALVHPSGRCLKRMLSVHSEMYVDGLRRLTDAVHEKGGLIAAQIVHGGRQCPPLLLGGQEPLAPSAVHDPSLGLTPRAMTDSQIWQTVEAFSDAAGRVAASGFDAVQLHAAHGFLISGFLSPHTNRRDDYWGGDEQRRFHFVEEVYKAVREAVGKKFPLLVKINSDDLLPGGITPAESLRQVLRLEALGLDAVEISGGMKESPLRAVKPGILNPGDEAYFRDSGALFKSKLRIPVILTGGMRSRAVMQDVLEKNLADLIGMSRPLIREPNLPALFEAGRQRTECISCNGCLGFAKMDYVKCVDLYRQKHSRPEHSGPGKPEGTSKD